MKILWSFLGMTDRRAAGTSAAGEPDLGPLARAAMDPAGGFDQIHIIDDRPETGEADAYINWLLSQFANNGQTPPSLTVHRTWPKDGRPVDLRATYCAAVAALDAVTATADSERIYNLSSGTSSMTMVFVLLANSERYGGRSLFVDRTRGIEWVDIPFDIRHALRQPAGDSLGALRFDPSRILSSFLVDSELLRAELALAQRLAAFDYTVLILGETGTGKEEVAFHMHLWRTWGDQAAEAMRSPAKVESARKSFRAINCAGLSNELLESELFGHERGAFTGAVHASQGLLREAGTGTVFLDEIAELSLVGQAKLLRALQSKTVRPVGAARESPFEARIIAASHRNLYDMARQGLFREDLLNRLTEGGVIRLPTLRARGDADRIAPLLLTALCAAAKGQLPALRLSDGALRRIREHSWPGNVRELLNILRQAAVRASGELVTERELSACLDARLAHDEADLLNRALPVDLDELRLALDRHYLGRAMEVGGSKANASRLVGFANAQTFANRYAAAMREDAAKSAT